MFGQRWSIKTRGRPNFNVPFLRGASGRIKTRRHDTDDPVEIRVHANALVQDLRIAAEQALPQRVANHDFRNKSRRVVLGIESAAELRLSSQQRKIIRRNSCQPDAGGLRQTGQIIFVKPHRRHVFENPGLLRVL